MGAAVSLNVESAHPKQRLYSCPIPALSIPRPDPRPSQTVTAPVQNRAAT